MSGFFDTNALLYFASAEPAKADRVSSLLRQGGWISVQVLNEASRVMRNKWKYEWAAIHEALAQFRVVLEIAPLDLETHQMGLHVAERYQLGIFDAMIVAAALQTGCDMLYTEDLQHGLMVQGRLKVTNPFASDVD